MSAKYRTGESLRLSLQILSKNDRLKLYLITITQIFLSALDLLGIFFTGLVGTLAISGLETRVPESRATDVIKFLGLANFTIKNQTLIIGLLALVFLIGRTLISVYFTRRIMFFLSFRGSKFSAFLVHKLLLKPMLVIQNYSTQELLFAVTRGVEIITLQILAVGVIIISDTALLIVLLLGLLLLDPWTALTLLLTFGTIGVLLYKKMHKKVLSLGISISEINIESNEKIIEVLNTYREAFVGNRRGYYADVIRAKRFQLSHNLAEFNFMPFVGKYVIETAVFVITLIVGISNFILRDASHAVSMLAIFLAATTRIAPAVLRIQQGAMTLRGGIGQAAITFHFIELVADETEIPIIYEQLDSMHSNFEPAVELSRISFKYPESNKDAISDISFEIPTGKSFAIVGPSGAGKTTLIDILLGLITPDFGTVRISGVTPYEAILKWPGAIAYVPQEVVIISGSIRENVAMGYPIHEATDELVMRAITLANLKEYVESLPKGLDTQVGEQGSKLSGGERQRLGIARAMFTSPKLLVLDEATSALDNDTESSISKSILSLKGSTTIVLIAHRLSTIRNADLVAYFSEGKLLGTGTFSQIRSAIPDFERQINLGNS